MAYLACLNSNGIHSDVSIIMEYDLLIVCLLHVRQIDQIDHDLGLLNPSLPLGDVAQNPTQETCATEHHEDHADYIAPTRQDELPRGTTAEGYICPQRSR